MNRSTSLLIPAFFGLLFTSCRKEITLDLESESNKVVIEAIIDQGPGPHTVHLSRSLAFEAPNTFPPISNATVTLSDDLGHSEQLTETAPGSYTTTTLQGDQQRTYRLNATVDGTTYSARCSMPVAVTMDTLLIDSFPAFGGYTRILVPGYVDPPGVANHYRFIVSVNGRKQEGINLQNDRFTDGNLVLQPLFLNDVELNSGDVVQVTMECITPAVYDYFFSMAQNVGNAATPADPVSNINGGALGYFSVRTTSSRTVVVP